MDDPDLIWTALLLGFIESMEESMELPCPKLRCSSRRRGNAWRRSKTIEEQIEEPEPPSSFECSSIDEEPWVLPPLIDEEPRSFWVLRRSKKSANFFFF
ncbi:hypothetical protein ACOSQ2_026930 [Xanthoceras sorbifolium]